MVFEVAAVIFLEQFGVVDKQDDGGRLGLHLGAVVDAALATLAVGGGRLPSSGFSENFINHSSGNTAAVGCGSSLHKGENFFDPLAGFGTDKEDISPVQKLHPLPQLPFHLG